MRLSIDRIRSYAGLSAPLFLLLIGAPSAFWIGSQPRHQPQIIRAPYWHFELQPGPSEPVDMEGLKRRIAVSSRDPFSVETRLPALPEDLPHLQLSMVLKNKRHKFCRINGVLYKEGQKGPDFEILRIEDDAVLITRYGKETWISLQEQKGT